MIKGVLLHKPALSQTGESVGWKSKHVQHSSAQQFYFQIKDSLKGNVLQKYGKILIKLVLVVWHE